MAGREGMLHEGEVGILNVGAGDTKLSFDPKNAAERIRAARIVTDMLRRGYALLVEVERRGKRSFQRVLKFQEDKCEYIIADLDPVAAAAADEEDDKRVEPDKNGPKEAAARRAPRGKIRPSRSIPAEGVRAVAVAPSAGG